MMRRVWVVIPLVIFGIVGVEKSFADDVLMDFNEWQNDLNRFVTLSDTKISLSNYNSENNNGISEIGGGYYWPKFNMTFPEQVKIGNPFDVVLDYTYVIPDEDTGSYTDPEEICTSDYYCKQQKIWIGIPTYVDYLNDDTIHESTTSDPRHTPIRTWNLYSIDPPFDNTKPLQETFTFVINKPDIDYPYGFIDISFHGSREAIFYFNAAQDGIVYFDDKVMQSIGDGPGQLKDTPISSIITTREQRLAAGPVDGPPDGLWNQFKDYLIEQHSGEDIREMLLGSNIKSSWIDRFLKFYPELNYSESFDQTNDLSDYPGEWHVGEGLKEGDYFSYSLCHVDYKECTEFGMDMWIKGDIQSGSETKWLADVVVYDGNKIIKGEMELGKIVAEPIWSSEELRDYRNAFRSSVSWLSAFATSDENSPGKEPKEFSDKTWNKKLIPMGVIGGPYPLRAETISIRGGTFDTVVVGWDIEGYNNNENEIWIVDDFPFPVKAIIHDLRSTDTSEIKLYEFELLDYHENVSEDPFQPVAYFDESFAESNLPSYKEGFTVGNVTSKIFGMTIEEKLASVPLCEDFSRQFPISFLTHKEKILKYFFQSDLVVIGKIINGTSYSLNEKNWDVLHIQIEDIINPNPNFSRTVEQPVILVSSKCWSPSGNLQNDWSFDLGDDVFLYLNRIHDVRFTILNPTQNLMIDSNIDLIPSPLVQNNAIQNELWPVGWNGVYCKPSLTSITKPSGEFACVTAQTAEKLMERGWAIS